MHHVCAEDVDMELPGTSCGTLLILAAEQGDLKTVKSLLGRSRKSYALLVPNFLSKSQSISQNSCEYCDIDTLTFCH